MIGGVPARTLFAAAVLVGAASAALAGAGPDALLPFRDMAGAATDVGVAFVVDFGGSSSPVVGCVKVPASDTGYDALTAFTTQEHWAPPTYNSAGLLCSINGEPVAPACGQGIVGGYQYWSYWFMTDGSGSWKYANRGASAPVGSARNGQDVEGWRFQNPGPDNPSAPAPRAAPAYSSICASVTAALTTTTTVPPSTATTIAPEVVTTTTFASTTTTVPSSSAPVSPATSTTSPPASLTKTPPTSSQRSALNATPTANDQAGGGSATPLIIGGLLILLLATGAVFGWRRRSNTP
jgi:hypothetical protein